MKTFDFFGQFILIVIALLLAIDYNGYGIWYGGFFMFVVGVWQLISTIVNMVVKSRSHLSFFRNNFIIALVYIAVVSVGSFFLSGFPHKQQDRILVITVMVVPPLLILRYWICIGRIYSLWFFKKNSFQPQNPDPQNKLGEFYRS